MTAEVESGYKQTEVGSIPEDWEVKSLGECLASTPRYGINAAAVPYSDRLPVYIRITDISTDGRFAPEKLVSVDNPQASNYHLLDGDIVLARTGASVGKSYEYDTSDGPLVFAGFLILIRPNPEKLLSGFISSYLSTKTYWDWVRLMSMRSGQPGINGKEYSRLPLPIPSIREQREISTTLSNVDDFIKSLDQLIAKKRDIQQAAMKQLLTGQRRLPGFSGEWEVRRLGDVADLKQGYAFKSEWYTEFGSFKIATIANVQDGWMKTSECSQISNLPEDLQPHHVLRVGEIIISMTGNVGRICKVSEPGWLLNQRVGKITPVKLDPEYLFYYLSQPSFSKSMMSKAKGGAQGNLNSSDITQFELWLPTSIDEKTAIATILSDMASELASLEARRDKARQLKQGMMQALLTGRVRLSEQSLSFETISPNFLSGLLSAPVFSSLFKCELNKLLESGGSAEKIMAEVVAIDRSANTSKTKPEDMFTHEPLKGLWKKHYFTAEFLAKNLENAWRGEKLTKAIENALAATPDDPEAVASELAQLVVGDTYRDKAGASRLTGEWIVYGEKDGVRYYLGLARHDEGDDVIYARLVAGCGQELIDSLKRAADM